MSTYEECSEITVNKVRKVPSAKMKSILIFSWELKEDKNCQHLQGTIPELKNIIQESFLSHGTLQIRKRETTEIVGFEGKTAD